MCCVQAAKQVQMLFNMTLANLLPDTIFYVTILQVSTNYVGFFHLKTPIVLAPNLNIISKVFG